MTGTVLSYKQDSIADEWDAIVIGSGIGGLAAAVLLARHGRKKVLVLERHYTAGGYTHSFRRPGYEWDVGVHYIGQVGDRRSAVRAAFDHLTDAKLDWAAMPDVYDRIIIGDRTYDFVTGEQRWRERMKEYFPNDALAIDRYLEVTRKCVKAEMFYHAEKIVPAPVAAVLGFAMRYPYLRWAGRTTAEVLAGITSNKELMAVLTGQWGDYGLPPGQSSFGIHSTIAQHYFDGGFYPVGGAGRIVETMTPLIQEGGGAVVVKAEVSQILIEGGRAVGVKMADERRLNAPIVISDAGAVNTFAKLLPEACREVEEIRHLPPSMAHLSLYVGANKSARELGLDGTNLWIYPGTDHDANATRWYSDPERPFPLVFISFPSAKDPTFETRHPGRATVEAITPAPYRWFTRWEDTVWKRRGESYELFKDMLAQRLMLIVEKHVPTLAGNVQAAELSTPLSTKHFMNHGAGEAYGVASTPERYRLRSLRPRTKWKGVFLTGQDVSSLGVTGAMFGGGICASAILGRNLISVMTKPA
ncbi:MAG: NAD(P)/FAD-dependent oxidoreductase [Bryobacterales bacterium]|nr:NAD(P)/FAD-dependent oxidoreductase [Bryobacterales bacterium]